MKASVKFDFSELRAAIKALGDAATARAAAEQDMIAAAGPMVATMRSLAPRDPGGRPGFGADTIHAEAVETRQEGEIARVGVGAGDDGWHLRFAEYGTSRHAAQPWLRPGVDQHDASFWDDVGARIVARMKAALR